MKVRDWIVRYPHYGIAILIFVALMGYLAGVHIYAYEARKQVAYDKARAFLESIVGMHMYYSREIVPRIKASGGDMEMYFADDPASFPFPAAVSIEFGGALQRVNETLDTKVYSAFPFPIRQSRSLDKFEEDSLAFLEANPDREFFRFETRDGIELIRYARAMKMREDCVECHNRPEFGFQGRWNVGDFRGARQVSLPVPDMTPIIDSATYMAVLIAIGASILGTIIVLPVVNRLRQSLNETRVMAGALDRKNMELEGAILARNRLFAGVSHDLRTPLNTIIGFSELLDKTVSKRPDAETERTYISYIHESGLHLQSLVEEVLEVSSLEEGKWKPRDNSIDVAGLMDGLEPMIRRALGTSGLNFEISVQDGLPILNADERALKRVIINLVDNAARYSGGSIVRIGASQDDTASITITVADDGAGIQEEQLSRLRQFRVRDSSSDIGAEAGLGMGLWLVDTLMAAHDAVVRFTETPDTGGLTVSIRFPGPRSLQ